MANNFIKILSGLFLGVVITLLYNYYNPNIMLLYAKHDQKFGFNLIKSLLHNNQILNDAIAVESTKSATQFGKEFYNNITLDGRRSIIAHPYDKQGSGAVITVFYTDSVTGERQLMLMEKLQNRNSLADGLAAQYDQIGGYTHGAGVEGTKISTLSFAEAEAKDKAEDENTYKGIAIQSAGHLTTQKNIPHITKQYLEEVSKAITQYYEQAVKENPYITNLNPDSIKNYLKLHGIEYNRDYNAIDTVIREFKEETGYNGIVTPSMIIEVYNADNYGVENVTNLHTKVAYYIIDLGKLDKAPIIYDPSFKSEREINSFQANGTEIGRLTWAGINKLELQDSLVWFNNKSLKGTRNIPILNNAIRILRDNELRSESQGIITSQDHIIALVQHFGLKANLDKVSGEFGTKSEQNHQRNKCIARQVSNSLTISSKSLLDAITQCQKNV